MPPPVVIDAVYRGLLDRPVEPDGLRHHLGMLDQGVAWPEVVHGIGHSREYFETWLRGGDIPAALAAAWDGARRRRGEPPLYFLHIMKTGGSALTAGLSAVAEGRFCLSQVFLDHLVGIPAPLLGMASVLAGHLGVMGLDYLPDGAVSATVLRDPLERVLSHYAHVLADPAIASSETAGLSLEEFVHSPRWRPYVENFQARNLVHRVDLAPVWHDRSAVDLLDDLDPATRPLAPRLPLQTYFELSPLECSEPLLRGQALDSLSRIEHVGTTESLGQLFVALAQVWGARELPALPRANVTARPVPADQVPPPLRNEILEANSVDLVLYEEARVRAEAATRETTRALVGLGGVAVGDEEMPAPRLEPPRHLAASSLRKGRPTSTVALGVAVVLAGVIAAVDAIFSHVVLAGLLAVAPCAALLTARWRTIGAVAALSTALATVLGVRDGIWGRPSHIVLVGTVAAVGCAVTAAAALADGRASLTRSRA